jgi:hypothetical protein
VAKKKMTSTFFLTVSSLRLFGLPLPLGLELKDYIIKITPKFRILSTISSILTKIKMLFKQFYVSFGAFGRLVMTFFSKEAIAVLYRSCSKPKLYKQKWTQHSMVKLKN